MTINKAKGQCFKVAGVDLKSDFFSFGQLYVACSRVSSSDSLAILQPEGKTKNLDYKEVLQNYSYMHGHISKFVSKHRYSASH